MPLVFIVVGTMLWFGWRAKRAGGSNMVAWLAALFGLIYMCFFWATVFVIVDDKHFEGGVAAVVYIGMMMAVYFISLLILGLFFLPANKFKRK